MSSRTLRSDINSFGIFYMCIALCNNAMHSICHKRLDMLLRNEKKEFVSYRNFACKIISNLPNGKYIELAVKPTYRKTKSLSLRFIVRFERLLFYIVSLRTQPLCFGVFCHNFGTSCRCFGAHYDILRQ